MNRDLRRIILIQIAVAGAVTGMLGAGFTEASDLIQFFGSMLRETAQIMHASQHSLQGAMNTIQGGSGGAILLVLAAVYFLLPVVTATYAMHRDRAYWRSYLLAMLFSVFILPAVVSIVIFSYDPNPITIKNHSFAYNDRLIPAFTTSLLALGGFVGGFIVLVRFLNRRRPQLWEQNMRNIRLNIVVLIVLLGTMVPAYAVTTQTGVDEMLIHEPSLNAREVAQRCTRLGSQIQSRYCQRLPENISCTGSDPSPRCDWLQVAQNITYQDAVTGPHPRKPRELLRQLLTETENRTQPIIEGRTTSHNCLQAEHPYRDEPVLSTTCPALAEPYSPERYY